MSPVLLYVAGMVLFGCLNTETTKIQFTLTSTGLDGEPKLFHKPWQAVFTMFLAMDVVLLYHVILSMRKPKVMPPDNVEPLISAEKPPVQGLKLFCIIGVPAVFDLLGTGFGMIGFVHLPASINQMLRGSTIVISAVFSVVFLRRKMYAYNWFGVSLCCVGIGMVGLSSVLNSEGAPEAATAASAAAAASSAAGAAFGVGMNLLGQVFAGGQIVAEEKLLKTLKTPPMQVVGYEGLWGTIIMTTVVFPLLYVLPGNDNGSIENVADTVTMWRNNHKLLWLILLYIFSCSTYNIAGMLVTGSLSAVHRTMLEASRTMFIWMINLSVYYLVDPNIGFAEAWTPWSFLQLAGFLVVIGGQVIYGGLVRLPCFTYDEARLPVASPSPASMYVGAGVALPDGEQDIEIVEEKDGNGKA